LKNKGPFTIKEIKGLPAGTQFWGKYLVKDKSIRKTREGKNITHLQISDKSGEMKAVVWDSCQQAGVVETGAVIGLLGDMGIYNQQVQVTAKRIKVLEEDPQAYMKSPDRKIQELRRDLEAKIASISDPHMKKLLERIFTSARWELFSKAPAAKAVHHNYIGGLIEHTLMVTELCDRAAGLYPNINRDLMITGAILHDIGKIEEFQIGVLPDYTEIGTLVGHIVLAYELLSQEIKNMREEGRPFPELLEKMLKNMLLSHHGSLEFGSPVLPLFPEALLLHAMDDLDAKLYVFFNKIEEHEDNDNPFTPYDSFHAQQFYTPRYRYSEQEE
jgi:3'-5' exoribonuclease